MVCANRSASFVRELDVFRSKLGIPQGPTLFEVASQNELQWNLHKFYWLMQQADHELPSADQR